MDSQGAAELAAAGQEPIVFAGHVIRPVGTNGVHQRLAGLYLGHVHGEALIFHVDGAGRSLCAEIPYRRLEPFRQNVAYACSLRYLFDQPEKAFGTAETQGWFRDLL